MSASTTARLLGMSFGFVMEAVRQGLLPAARVKSNLLALPVHGVARVVQEYVTTSEIRFHLPGSASPSGRSYDRHLGVPSEAVLFKAPLWRRDKLAAVYPALRQPPG